MGLQGGLQLQGVSPWSFSSSNLPPLHVLVFVCDVRSCSSHPHHPAVQKVDIEKAQIVNTGGNLSGVVFYILCFSLEP